MLLEYSETGPAIGIPYDRCERADGTNHGYVDLKWSPEKIVLIPELDDYPELFRFVRDVNSEASLFRTAGCAVREFPEGTILKYRSFVHLLFEILHWNTSGQCYRTLFETFRIWLAGQKSRPIDASIVFTLGPTSFWHHRFDGVSLRVFIEGRGGSWLDARTNWGAGLNTLSRFCDDFSSAHQPQLRNCAKRVS